MSNSIAPGSSADVNVKVTALTTNPNVPVTYKTIILKKNLVNGVNTLAQEMMSATNTKYVIKYDYVLGDDITVPENCILEFDGGSIAANDSYDTVIGNSTNINANRIYVFKNIEFDGTWKLEEIYPEWFGAVGDFNVTLGYGTDDSSAFTKAISFANKSNVNLVTLDSRMYCISTGINVYDGNIKIQGSYANLREDQCFTYNTNVNEVLGSSLVAYGLNGAIITVNSSVTHPIHISSVGFYNLRSIKENEKPIAIKCSSEFTGPLWPVYIEKCYFRGFYKAIYTDSALAYNISSLIIRDCAFILNDVCVQFAHAEGRSIFNGNYAYNFMFVNNFAHQNAHILDISIAVGCALITDNNLEGPLSHNIGSESLDYNSISRINVASNASVFVERNYMEAIDNRVPFEISVKKYTIGENTLSPINSLVYKDNKPFATDTDYIYVNGASAAELDNYLHLKWQLKIESDTKVRVKGTLHVFIDNYINDICLVDNGHLCIHTKEKIDCLTDSLNENTIELHSIVSINKPWNGSGSLDINKKDNKIFCSDKGTARFLLNPTSPTSQTSKYFVVAAECYSDDYNIIYKISNPIIRFFDDSTYGVGAFIMAAKDYRWCYSIRHITNYEYSRKYLSYLVANTGYFSTCNIFIINTGILWLRSLNVVDCTNVVDYNMLSGLTNVEPGFAVFCASGASLDGGTTETTNIPIYYTGSGWVDANGNNVVAKS